MTRPAFVWVLADTHFYHNRLKELAGRPEGFERKILVNTKHLVTPIDTLVHLGDVIWYRYPMLKGILDTIECHTKVLVKGNHDRKTRDWFQRNGFNFVCDSFVLGEVIFSHAPMEQFPSGVCLNVHGHLHNATRVPREPWYQPGVRHALVALENTDYKPVRLDQLLLGVRRSRPVTVNGEEEE
jgi:calcineurin-like phosphoesterase family protein